MTRSPAYILPPLAAPLQTPPSFLEEHQVRAAALPTEIPAGFRARAGSEPSDMSGSRPVPHPRERPVDGHPLNQLEIEEKEDFKRGLRHKRKKSNIAASIPRRQSISRQQVQVSEANNRFPQAEIASIQRKAMRQCEKFNVLSLDDVEILSRELLQLDSRCEYLRQTRASLRQGRQTLQKRMLLYLRTARPGAFSQDNLLKQEEALADLDVAIEDWETKLEKVHGIDLR
jgi:hypothetical protein